MTWINFFKFATSMQLIFKFMSVRPSVRLSVRDFIILKLSS